MAIRFTVNQFPANVQLKDDSGIPWGCVVQPFASDEKDIIFSSAPLPRADEIARCEECFAYISGFCHIQRSNWSCALCDTVNTFSEREYRRYSKGSLLENCPELAGSLVELDVATEEDRSRYSSGEEQEGDVYTKPVYVALVDLTAPEDVLELVKSALLAALEALSPSSLFGLVTFSHKIGLYDLQGSVPVVKHVPIPELPDGGFSLELQEVMPLQAFLAPVDANKDHIGAALETLRPVSAQEYSGPPSGAREQSLGGATRGFGTAVAALLRYLGADEGETFVSARLFAFLAGAPNRGPGQLDTQRYAELAADASDVADQALLTEQTPFYKELAAQAVQVGVCIDLFAVTREYVDLASLKFLSVESGGGVFLYPSPEEATLPQDMYRMLCRPHAVGGVLRLRASPAFRPARAYGHFFPDAQYDDVFHVIACGARDAYAFDFEFAGGSGFGHSGAAHTLAPPPTVQMAFQYTVLVPAPLDPPAADPPTTAGQSPHLLERPGPPASSSSSSSSSAAAAAPSASPQANGHGGAAAGHGAGEGEASGVEGPARRQYVLRRRLRVKTVQLKVAHTLGELFQSVDQEVAIQASLEEGVREGRLLLQDWLVILTASYNQHFQLAQFREPATGPQLDVSFQHCPPLAPLARSGKERREVNGADEVVGRQARQHHRRRRGEGLRDRHVVHRCTFTAPGGGEHEGPPA
eukprot:jgi/Mesen1/10685/ME000009S10481